MERMQMLLPQRAERMPLPLSCAESINIAEGGENAMPLPQRVKRMQITQSGAESINTTEGGENANGITTEGGENANATELR